MIHKEDIIQIINQDIIQIINRRIHNAEQEILNATYDHETRNNMDLILSELRLLLHEIYTMLEECDYCDLDEEEFEEMEYHRRGE